MNKSLISFCSGVFDAPPDNCPHQGHLYILQQMRLKVGPEGQVIVALNPDSYIVQKKGREPLSNWLHRRDCLLKTGLVDKVYVSDDGLYELIKKLKVDLIFVGDDYSKERVIGNSLAEVVIISRLPNISTSEIIAAQNLKK
jgi:glycerol-3-phosphate cytidylyltransferase-like family protein